MPRLSATKFVFKRYYLKTSVLGACQSPCYVAKTDETDDGLEYDNFLTVHSITELPGPLKLPALINTERHCESKDF